MTQRSFTKPPSDVLRSRLSPLAFQVTQAEATEPPFRNAFWDHHEEGLYVDVVTGEPLFSSRDKFDSGTGWPSFTRAIEPARVRTRTDWHIGVPRTEVRSAAGDSHLGHVFEDGPKPTGLRYCINSAALRFIPKDQLESEGYGPWAAQFEVEGASARPSAEGDNACAAPSPGQAPGCATNLEQAVLAGGCFWGMEELLRAIPGVLDTEVGYTGGQTPQPTYEQVRTGKTGHAEAVWILFDPSKLSYAQLLERWFFRMHDPTTRDRQGNDRGSQYRSAIFYTSPEQKRTAEEVLARVEASGRWKAPLVTEVRAAGTFTAAEGYHQDYLQQHPGGYSCHFLRPE